MHHTNHSILFIVSVNTYFQDTNPSLSLQNRNLNNNFKNLIIKTFHPLFFMVRNFFSLILDAITVKLDKITFYNKFY